MNSKKYSNVSQRVPFHLKIIDAVFKKYLEGMVLLRLIE